MKMTADALTAVAKLIFADFLKHHCPEDQQDEKWEDVPIHVRMDIVMLAEVTCKAIYHLEHPIPSIGKLSASCLNEIWMMLHPSRRSQQAQA